MIVFFNTNPVASIWAGKNINIKMLVNLLIEKKIVHLHPNFDRK
jgi:hypothetical protein